MTAVDPGLELDAVIRFELNKRAYSYCPTPESAEHELELGREVVSPEYFAALLRVFHTFESCRVVEVRRPSLDTLAEK